MALPLPLLTFYRLADVTLAGTLISDLLDGFYTALTATVDYRGTTIPATHLWPTAQKRPVVVTEALDLSPPAGTPMTRSPRILLAGRIANAGTMAAPDTSLASMLQVGINKLGGAYVDWSAAAPYGSGNWFGYWRAAATAANAVGTIIRVFLSQETVYYQIIQNAATQYWGYVGATIEPFTNDTVNDAETDNRLYGMFANGGTGGVGGGWLSQPTNDWLLHGAANGNFHGGVWVPGTGTIQTVSRLEVFKSAALAGMQQTPSGAYVGARWSVVQVAGSNNRLGTIRGLFPSGLVQSGKYLRNGATDLYHFVGMDTTLADDAMLLPAAA